MTLETKKRIVSTMVMIGLFSLFFSMGQTAFFFFTTVIALYVIDEILCHFLGKKRFSSTYIVVQCIFLVPFLSCHFYPFALVVDSMKIMACLVNMGMIFYLFFVQDSPRVISFTAKCPWVAALFILLPFVSLDSIMRHEQGRPLFLLLLVINYSMDTGAWFFGKLFGRHKLCPSISPNKTKEGFMGGMTTAVLAGGGMSSFVFGGTSLWTLLGFALLGFISQMGDLIQSKLKRQFHLKDSSSLIPGHGGVYDRVDSLLFATPFVALALDYYN